jgi:enoyl-CoA hydratase/carnithine racemase
MVLKYEKRGRIAYITLNRPEALNAFSPQLVQAFSDALIDFRDDEEMWVAIITGAGERAFSAGADIKTLLPKMREQVGKPWLQPVNIMRGLEVWKPLIAAINGHALGGGLEVVLACDIRIASENATFGQPEVRLGIIPGWGGTARLPRMIPFAKAAEILLTGQAISAQEALRLGLINEVVPLPELIPTAERWAERIMECGPLAIRASKEIMIKCMSMSLEESLKLEREWIERLFLTQDFEEGRQAFIDKRKAKFQAK